MRQAISAKNRRFVAQRAHFRCEYCRLHETDNWYHHFEAIQGKILAKTLVGEATLRIFRFNHPDLLILRQLLTQQGRYP